jgi:peptidoglycan/LPS O-acetylase OafA/YrhL
MLSLFPRLRRITSGATWIPEIDGLRFVAVFSVVMFHLTGQVVSKSGYAVTTHPIYGYILPFLANSARGVELFFVISGFILGRPFARHYLLGEKKVPLGNYYLRRLTRLEPPYLLNLLLCAIAIHFYIHTPIGDLAKHLLVSAIYGHQLFYRNVSTLNGVTWSLEIEIQFYLLVPLLVLIYRVRNAIFRRGALLFTMLIASSCQYWLFGMALWQKPAGVIYSTIFFYLQYFLAGLLLSDIYLTSLPQWRPSRWWDLASLICWPTYFYFFQWWPPTWMPFLLIIAFIGAFRGIYFPRFFRIEWIALIGGMCYSIYLWHFFVIALIFKATKHISLTHDYLGDTLVQSVLLLPVILVWSTIYYLLIERPCMDPRWPQKLYDRLKLLWF